MVSAPRERMPASVAGPLRWSKGAALVVRWAPGTARALIPRSALLGLATPKAWLRSDGAYPWCLGFALAAGRPWCVRAPGAYLWGRRGRPRTLLLLAGGQLALAAERVLGWAPLPEPGASPFSLATLLEDPAFNPFIGELPSHG